MGMRRMISPSMALLLVLVLVLSGCFGGGSKKPEEKYQLTISVDGPGSVDPKPGKWYAKKDFCIVGGNSRRGLGIQSLDWQCGGAELR